MKITLVVLCLLIVSALIIGGCRFFRSPSTAYSIQLFNIGSKPIYLNKLVLYKGALEWGDTKVLSSQSAFGTVGEFGKKPPATFDINWKDLKTGKQYTAIAKIALPKRFYSDFDPCIVFYLNSDDNTAKVVYQLYGSKKSDYLSDYIYVNSDGTPSKLAERYIALKKLKGLKELLALKDKNLTEKEVDKIYDWSSGFYYTNENELKIMNINVNSVLELCKNMSNSKKLLDDAKNYFKQNYIKNPTVKLYWAMLFIQKNSATTETNKYLKKTLKTPEGRKQLTEWLGGETQLKAFEKKLNTAK